MATVVRAAFRRIGGRALRPSLAAAAHLQPHPAPALYKVAVPHERWSSTCVPALVPPTPYINRKFHLEVCGKLLPEIGFTSDCLYKISICNDNAEFASNLVCDFIKALQSNAPEDLERYLSHKVSIVEVKKLVGGAVMEITLQGMERTAEVRFEIEALKQRVEDEATSTRAQVERLKTSVVDTKKVVQEMLNESTSTRAQVESLKTTVDDTKKEVQEMHTGLSDQDFVKVVIRGTVANVVCTFLIFMSGKVTSSMVTEAAVEIMNYISS